MMIANDLLEQCGFAGATASREDICTICVGYVNGSSVTKAVSHRDNGETAPPL